MPVAGAPMLERMMERILSAQTPFELVVATTTDPGDDRIEALCRAIAVGCFRGHPTDLLDRHYQAALAWEADQVVKIPSDCPLVDPAVIDRVLGFARENEGRFDFVSNLHPPTYPDGSDVAVMPFAVLETAWAEARRPFEREHTTPFIWDRPERFRIGNVVWETGADLAMTHRLTVDYPEDYALVAAVFDALWSASRPLFHLDEILEFLADHPEVYAQNARYAGVNWYRQHLGELRTVTGAATRPAPPSTRAAS